jgi:predicted transposase/invertase (TIGR01784 family)
MSANRLKHDQLFRKALENPIVAKEFFQAHLPKRIQAIVDTSTLKMEKDSFIEQNLKNSISDVLFSIKAGNSDGYLYLLLEHQSTPDHFMAFRLLRYMVNICSRHLTLNKDTKHLPFVYPMIFFNGKKQYNVPRNIWDLFDNSILTKEIWSNDLKVINVHDIPDDELKKRAWSGIMEFFLKHIHERELLNRWQEVAELLPQFAKVSIGFDYIETVLFYTLTKIKQDDRIELENLLVSKLNQDTGKKLMKSLAKHWEDEGIQKGIERGIQKGKSEGIQEGATNKAIEIATNMLRQNLDTKLISQVTGLSSEQINKLKSKI